MAFLNINGAIVANTVYCNNKLVAKDVEITLPEVAPVLADVEAMGTMSFPIWQRIDNMELSFTKIGLDLGLGSIMAASIKPLEFRFPQETIDANGNTRTVSCKAFIKCIPTTIPEIGAVPGESSAIESAHTVTRYQLYVDGKEIFTIDRLAGLVRINGKDMTKGLQSML